MLTGCKRISFPSTPGTRTFSSIWVNENDDGQGQPEFCRAHAQGDQQDRNGNEKCANGRKKLAKKREHAKDKCRLHADQPKQRADGDAGDCTIDGDSARPRNHLSHESRECAMGLLAITIRREREIRGDERPGIGQYKNEQEHGENGAGYSADQTNCRS